MYYRHFGLSGPPFQFTPAAELLYLGRTHLECIAALEWALVHESCGFMLLVGETGTGKTTLICSLMARRFSNLHLACVTNPRLPFGDILRMVLSQLGVASVAGGRLQLVQAFENFLASQPAGDRTAIVIDEAQDLNDDSLEDLRLLANSNGGVHKELQFILIGQPELLNVLSKPHMRQIRERIGAKAVLNPLSPEESLEYVDFRLQAQQGKSRAIFEPRALKALISSSGGIPRRLNVLCHNALLTAYAAGARTVTLRVAFETVKDFESIYHPEKQRAASEAKRNPFNSAPAILGRMAPAVMVVLSLFLLGFGAVIFWVENASGHNFGHKAAPVAGYTSVVPAAPAASERLPVSVEGAIVPVASSAIAGTKAPAASLRRQVAVRAGDTLERIAIEYLGSADRLADLIHENPQIQDFDVVYPGQIVYLPRLEDASK